MHQIEKTKGAMPKKRVMPAWIDQASKRKAKFRKRKGGLLKKVRELSILCSVEAFLVMYDYQSVQPVVWSSRPDTKEAVTHFMSLTDLERRKKMIDQADFLRGRVKKMEAQRQKHERDIRELETTCLMEEALAGKRLDEVDTEEATRLTTMIESKMKLLEKKIGSVEAKRLQDDAARAMVTLGEENSFIEERNTEMGGTPSSFADHDNDNSRLVPCFPNV